MVFKTERLEISKGPPTECGNVGQDFTRGHGHYKKCCLFTWVNFVEFYNLAIIARDTC